VLGVICLLNEGGVMLNVFRVITSGVVLGAILLSGCGNSAEPDEAQQEKSPVKNENPESNTGETQNAEVIKKGVGDVIQSIKGLETELSAEADPERIQEMGKEMSSVWDSIEKQVEDEYPDWYERIEKNLYPLIGVSGNP
jgi:iron uptake system EfeUOB component EfeO/EfeM